MFSNQILAGICGLCNTHVSSVWIIASNGAYYEVSFNFCVFIYIDINIFILIFNNIISCKGDITFYIIYVKLIEQIYVRLLGTPLARASEKISFLNLPTRVSRYICYRINSPSRYPCDGHLHIICQ